MAWGGVARAEGQKITVGKHREMTATLFVPDGPGPFPAILVLHTSGGLRHADIAYAERLSREGYVTLVPEFLDAYGVTPQKRRNSFTIFAEDIYDDFNAAIATLKSHPKVAGGKVGAVGFSNGGYFTAWLAATGKIAAGVSYYGAYNGAGTDNGLDRFSEAFTANSAPLLVLHGTSDGTVNIRVARHLLGIMTKAGAPFQSHFYEGADHVFEREIESDAAKARAEDAWKRTLDFFNRHLKGATKG